MREQLPNLGAPRGNLKKNWLPLDALSEPNGDPVRLTNRKSCDIERLALPSFAIATGSMVGLSAPALIDPSGVTGWLKVGLFTASAALVSYVVNKYAIEDGADLAGRGYWSAGIVSVGSILLVGGGLFASTYAGLTIERVDALALQQHGQALGKYIAQTKAAVGHSAQIRPALQAALNDISAHVACEEAESCLSGRGKGGRGPVTRALEPVAKRANEITLQLKAGEQSHRNTFRKLNVLLQRYQRTAADSTLGRSEMRAALSQIDSSIIQLAGAVHEAIPTALLKSYSNELADGLTIARRPAAESKINALMNRHGAGLKSALGVKGNPRPVVPAFPDPAGVSQTFAYIGHFLPMAALTAVIELIMPLTLWVYALLSHLWRNYKTEPTDLDHVSKTKRVA